MIKFIDLNTGNIFNGEQPYCFWFDEGQSVRINYVKPICLISDKPSINISMKNEGIFNLLDVANIQRKPTLKLNSFDYKNLNDLLVVPKDNKVSLTLNGYTYENGYIYMVYVYANSLETGTYQQILTIDKTDYLIAADFYNENETLKSNVQNFGLDLPDSIQKAIYDSNIHEEARDNILMNRKYKELLIEYKDIIANKGSYKSLEKSLNWFEYGDLVKIQEYWRNNNSKNSLTRKDLSPLITDELFNILNTYQKTTYIGLYLTLNKIHINENGEVVYKQNENINVEKLDTDGNPQIIQSLLPEPVPELVNISAKFTKEILSLKMSMLGCFYGAYFMPIHLDLLHSTIEHIVYSNTIKIQNFKKVTRNDYMDYLEGFDCNLKAENIFYLVNNKVGVTKKTELGNDWKVGQDYDDIQLFGVDKLEDINKVNEDELQTLWTQLYSGISAFIPIECILPVSSKTDVIQEVQITHNNKMLKMNKIILQSNNQINVKFNLLFKKPLYDENGNIKPYYIGIKLILNTGKSFIRHFKIYIYDDTYQNIDVYKLSKLNQSELNEVFNDGKNLDWNLFAFDTEPSIVNEADINIPKTFYTQYITPKNNLADVGLTKQWQYKLFTNKQRLINTLTYINKGVPVELTDINKTRELLLKNILLDKKNPENNLYNLFSNNKSICFGDILIRNKYTERTKSKNEDLLHTYLFFLEKGYNVTQQEYSVFNFENYLVVKNENRWVCNFKLYKELNLNSYFQFLYSGNKNVKKLILKVNDEKTYEYSGVKNDKPILISNFNFKKGDEIKLQLYSDDNLYINKNIIVDINPVDIEVHQTYNPPVKLYVYGRYASEDNDSYRNILNVQDNIVEDKDVSIKYLEELKFIPQFHKIIKLNDDEFKLKQTDIFCLIPNFYHILTPDNIKWKFINESTNKTIIPTFKNNQFTKTLEPFALPYNQTELEPGYYSFELNYAMDKTPLKKILNSRLLIEKNNV